MWGAILMAKVAVLTMEVVVAEVAVLVVVADFDR
jgi:hypothetical protein